MSDGNPRGGGELDVSWLRFVLPVAVALTVAAAAAPLAVAGPAAATSGDADALDRSGRVGATSGAGAAAVDAASARTGIASVNVSGPGVAVRQNNTTYVWADGNVTFRGTVYPLSDPGEHQVCLRLVTNGTMDGTTTTPSGGGETTVRDYGCQTRDVASYGARVTFDVRGFGTNVTGAHAFVFTLRQGGRNDTARLPVVIVERAGDLDGDGLSNEKEVKRETKIDSSDTDSDGLSDGDEVKEYDSSPTRADTDGDGARDAIEIQEGTDPMDPDSDDDGLSDGEELNKYGTDPMDPDSDDDGLSDREELKKYDTDPMDPDSDNDGVPDGAEVEQDTNPLRSPTPGIASGPLEALGGLTGRFTLIVVGLGILLLVGVAVAAYARYEDLARGDADRPGTPSADVGTDGGGGPGDDLTDPELLTPDQHVLQLLEANGGQMRQSDIVEETDWSKAKVSRTLSSMEEDDTVKRVRIGRGNVVTYPGNDPSEDV